MLWLSLYLPHLALEVFLRGAPSEGPFAVVTSEGNRQIIHARNRAAAKCGIVPGMPLGAARSLSNELHVRPRDLATETEALTNIAMWSGQFTPILSLQPPQNILMEIRGSLALFGGITPLYERIAGELKELGYHGNLAVAPTPRAACLLSRAGYASPVMGRQELYALFRNAPLSVLDLPEKKLALLHGMGLRRIGDCLALPRAGLGKRLGPEFLPYLDKILGYAPDPQPRFTAPPQLESRLALPAETDNVEALLFAQRRLLQELRGRLIARGAAVQELELELEHHQGPVTSFPVRLVAPTQETDHLMQLLREHLGNHELRAPVEAITVRISKPLPSKAENQDLFTGAQPDRDWHRLVEHLQARLGTSRIMSVQPVADHRPELAWRESRPGETETKTAFAERPLWLLTKPERLQTVDDQPLLGGPLIFRQGPERIESGWWDGGDVARDYFIAENPRSERYWIFRERRPPREWYLHGIFS